MHRMIIAAERYWEMVVAQATPATSILNPMTNRRFSTTLTRPETIKKYMGRLVSPTARSMAAAKLYTISAGVPTK